MPTGDFRDLIAVNGLMTSWNDNTTYVGLDSNTTQKLDRLESKVREMECLNMGAGVPQVDLMRLLHLHQIQLDALNKQLYNNYYPGYTNQYYGCSGYQDIQNGISNSMTATQTYSNSYNSKMQHMEETLRRVESATLRMESELCQLRTENNELKAKLSAVTTQHRQYEEELVDKIDQYLEYALDQGKKDCEAETSLKEKLEYYSSSTLGKSQSFLRADGTWTNPATEPYDPTSLTEDFIFPATSVGKGSRVENLPELSDIDYFRKMAENGIRIPKRYLGLSEIDSSDLAATTDDLFNVCEKQEIQKDVGYFYCPYIPLFMAGKTEAEISYEKSMKFVGV